MGKAILPMSERIQQPTPILQAGLKRPLHRGDLGMFERVDASQLLRIECTYARS
jgi:hypothetical protein